MGDTLWYVARASGIVAWFVCALSIVWGLALSTRVLGRHPSGARLLDAHRYLGGLSVCFLGVHVVTLMLHRFGSISFGPAAVLVPGASTWRPGAIAFGVVAMYVLVAVEVTSLLRNRLPDRAWRSVHLLSYVSFVAASLHGLQAGTDRNQPMLRLLAFTAAAVVAGLTIARVARGTVRDRAPRPGRIVPAMAGGAAVTTRTTQDAPLPAPPTAARVAAAASAAALLAASAPVVEDAPPADAEAEPDTEAEPETEAEPVLEAEVEAETEPLLEADAEAEPVALAELPRRVPQRIEPTTESARLGEWQPENDPVLAPIADALIAPAPPAAVDGVEPSRDEYRRWLREWLTFVEHYDG